MPQRQQRIQDIKSQYSDMFRWQREQLVARKTLSDIYDTLPQSEDIIMKAKDTVEEDRRLAFFQGLAELTTDQYQRVHQSLKQEHDILVSDIRTLHRLVAQPL